MKLSSRLSTMAVGLGLAFNVAAYDVSPIHQEVPVSHNGGLMDAWLFTADIEDSDRPTVIMMHGCSGAYSWSNPSKGVYSLYRKWGDRLVAAGYNALLLDSFTYRNAEQKQCGNGSDGTSEVEDRPFDVEAAHEFLQNQSWSDGDNIALLGWSHGGSSVMASIHEDHINVPADAFKAAIAFYPGCGLYSAFNGIQNSEWVPNTPLKIFHASEDSLYQSGHCDTRINNAELIDDSVDIEMIVYEGAQHSFDAAKQSSSKWTVADFVAQSSADVETLIELQVSFD